MGCWHRRQHLFERANNRLHPSAELRAWYATASRARWKRPSDVKDDYRNASFITNNRVVFNIKGNAYRLLVC